MNRLIKLRRTAQLRQNNRCYYCQCTMWSDDPEGFRLQHDIRPSRLARFQCTAEHLVARCEGGKDTAGNVVAACHECNWRRHHEHKKPLDPKRYQDWVMKQVRSRHWPTTAACSESRVCRPQMGCRDARRVSFARSRSTLHR